MKSEVYEGHKQTVCVLIRTEHLMSTTKLDSAPALFNSSHCFDSSSVVTCQFSCNRSAIFDVIHFPAPSIWSVIFQVLHFPALQFGPSFLGPANSAPPSPPSSRVMTVYMDWLDGLLWSLSSF